MIKKIAHKNDNRIVGIKTKKSTSHYAPFTIKLGLMMMLLISFVLPLVLFSPLLVAKLLGLDLIDRIGMTADNFGSYVLTSQAIGLVVSFIIIAKKLKKQNMSWSNVGLKCFKTFQAIRYVVGYYLILLGLLVVVAIIASSIGVQAPENPDASNGVEMLSFMGCFWYTFALSVVLAPIVEEVVFRGILFPAISRRYGTIMGVIVSSLVFTLVHINPIQMLSVLPLGIYLAIMYRRTGSIYPGMILHATWNLFVLIIAQSSI